MKKKDKICLVLIADTHLGHYDVVIPDGDILVVAGDFSEQGQSEVVDFNASICNIRGEKDNKPIIVDRDIGSGNFAHNLTL